MSGHSSSLSIDSGLHLIQRERSISYLLFEQLLVIRLKNHSRWKAPQIIDEQLSGKYQTFFAFCIVQSRHPGHSGMNGTTWWRLIMTCLGST